MEEYDERTDDRKPAVNLKDKDTKKIILVNKSLL